MKIAGYRVHPAAELFPLLDGPDFEDLCDDIRANGLREPAWVLLQDHPDGEELLILDGRNRLRACEATGTEPVTQVYGGDDPVGFVMSLNLHRRHMTDGQRAMVASRLAGLGRGRPRSEDKAAHLPVIDPQPDQAAHLPVDVPVTQTRAAELLGVGERSVRNARKVTTRGVPELVEAVERGDVALGAAVEVADLPREQQREALAGGPIAVRDAARRARSRGKAKPAAEPLERVTAEEVRLLEQDSWTHEELVQIAFLARRLAGVARCGPAMPGATVAA